MWDMFTHSSNLIFSISLSLMLLLCLIECLCLIIGSSSQGFLDQFLPEQLLEPQNPEIELTTDQSVFFQFLEWLYIGRIPMLVWLIVFLTTYSLTGFITQSIIFSFITSYAPLWIIAPICLIICMPVVRLVASILSRILPKDETTAIKSTELIGRTAIIILGEARQNYPAQARVKDQFGQSHYILVEPEENITLQQGQEVLLSEQTSIGFRAQPIHSS